MYITIDPGHGGSDPGAVGSCDVKESDITLMIALYLEDMLLRDGHSVFMTRSEDIDVGYPNDSGSFELQARCDIANNSQSDIFVSIHCNSFNADSHGTETWYEAGSLLGMKLAGHVQKNLVNSLDLVDRGLKNTNEERLYVLVRTKMPAILTEIAFISNPNEESLLADDDFQQRAAKAIYDGINEYFA